MSEYQKYPMWMAHPNGMKSEPVKGPPDANRSGVFAQGNIVGTVEKFPPITVHNEDQEAQYEAKGYQPAGKNNPWAGTTNNTPVPPSYVPQEYPKYVGDKLVQSAEEERALLAPIVPAVMAMVGNEDGIVSPKSRAWSPERRAAHEAKRNAKMPEVARDMGDD